MATLPILIQHGGRWDSNNRFVDYSVEGVVISTETKFIDFVSTISKQLMIDTTINLLEIQYKCDEDSPPMMIHNDMGLRVYIELKKKNYAFNDGDTLQLIAFDNVDDPEVVDFDETPIIDDPLNNTVSEGQLYKDKETLMMALKNYAIQKKFQFKVDRSSPSRVRKFSKDHTCSARDRLFTQRVATAPIIGRIICDKYVDPKTIYTAKDIMKDMKKHYGIDLSYWKANRSKQKALQFLRGDPSKIFPLAYAIVDKENDASWGWFFERFKEAFGDRDDMCIVSDRNESIAKAASIVYPQVSHCVELTNRNTAQATFTKLTFKYNAILDENLDASQHMIVGPSTENLHSVIDNGRLFIVYLRERTCSCRRFQLDQIPCPHAWAVLRSKNLEGEDYCSMYYNNEYMLKAYDIPIYPLPDESTWTIPVEVLEQAVLPPVWNKMPGRPKKVRYKKVSESQAKRPKSSCGQCGREGHNRRTCRNIPYNH
ncbi:uncharacterized protein [Nicotiana sylvestris]|uniref:uncharacterized protein n=1 Tax=Nicotiana sylvestris TaxID=4096 RepID=UPI00388CB1A9